MWCDFKIFDIKNNEYILYKKFQSLEILNISLSNNNVNINMMKNVSISDKDYPWIWNFFYNPIFYILEDKLMWIDFYNGVFKNYQIPWYIFKSENESKWNFETITHKNVDLGNCKDCLSGSWHVLYDGTYNYIVIHNKHFDKCFETKIYEKHVGGVLVYWFSIIKIKNIENFEKSDLEISEKYVLFQYNNEKTIGYLFINGAVLDNNNKNIMILSGGVDDQINVFLSVDLSKIKFYSFDEWLNDKIFIEINNNEKFLCN